jgi:hypothetical protein
MEMEIIMAALGRTLPWLALIAGLLAVGAVFGTGPLHKAGTISWLTILHGLRYGAFLGMAAGGIGVIAIIVRLISGQGALALALVGLLLGGAAFGFVMNFRAQAGAVPPIHDITTDTENPPAFVAAIAAREAGVSVNPPEYVGDQPEPGDTGRTIREAQLAAYPDLQSVFVDADRSYVFTASMAIVEEMGWDLLEANTQEGRIEATATTGWYGFKDDVVIRIEELPGGAIRVDVRSKSRVGVSDVGANAARIEAFLTALRERTGS